MQQGRQHVPTRGFTLVELMISIAIVLLLVAGINLIFQTTSKAVGAGQALSEGARNNQAAQAVMFKDFSACATDDAPYLIIYNHATPAFRTLADQQSDRDYNASDTATNRAKEILTTDRDQNNSEADPIDTLSPAIYNDRNHRIDMISFFARGVFRRQTGNPGTYVANESASEAMVWYGHMAIPDNNGTLSANSLPGAGTFNGASNPNNFFASQWIVGRQAILLNGNPDVAPVDSANQPQAYFTTNSPNADPPPDLSPLTLVNPVVYPSGVTDDTNGQATLLYSRFDVCDTSLKLFNDRLEALINDPVNSSNVSFPNNVTWWPSLMGGQNSNRFVCDPFITKPITSAQFAKTSPIFLDHCSQFIVEYAGDFLTQSTAGSDLATAVKPDGTIDFYYPPATPQNPYPQRKIRWYGLPRNVDTSDDTLTGEVIAGTGRTAMRDVVPLKDVIAASGLTLPNSVPNTSPAFQPWFERNWPANSPSSNYAATGTGLLSTDEYLCAWGPRDANRPSLIRITYTLDDPQSRLGSPLTYEYVFKIK